MAELGHPVFDADNHYYEAEDAFTRHLDPKMAARTLQWAEIDGRKYHVIGGKVSRAVSNPTFNPIAKPGCLHDYLRGNMNGKNPLELFRDREPLRPEYIAAEKRFGVLDRQGLEAAWVFPTLGMLYEELLKHDPVAVSTLFESFNRWLHDDWGFANQGRIFTAPYISLADVEWAKRELEWALSEGARIFVMRPSAVWTADGPKSPGDPHFDSFWARVSEAGITAVIHAGDSGYTTNGYAQDKFGANFGDGGGGRPSVKAWAIERAAMDFLATCIFDKLFERFPGVRIAAVENGSEYLPDLFRKLNSMGRRMPGYFSDNPVDIFKRHVWINPFWEDDVEEVVAHMGANRVIFGSDWPHIEGMPQPLDYLKELEPFSAADRKMILLDNVRELNALASV